jgi:hypothetical protein
MPALPACSGWNREKARQSVQEFLSNLLVFRKSRCLLFAALGNLSAAQHVRLRDLMLQP